MESAAAASPLKASEPSRRDLSERRRGAACAAQPGSARPAAHTGRRALPDKLALPVALLGTVPAVARGTHP